VRGGFIRSVCALILPLIHFNSAAAYKSILSFTCIFKTHIATFGEANSGMHSYPGSFQFLLSTLGGNLKELFRPNCGHLGQGASFSGCRVVMHLSI